MKAIRIADSLDNPGEKLVRIRHDHIEHSVPMAEAEELITDLIRLGVPCRVAEALLRQNDSAIAVGNDCEIARRGTTAELAKYVAVAQSEQETVLDAWLRRAREAEEQLAEIQETTRRVMTEECAPDEKHCTCVPILRTQLAEQQRVGLFLQAAHGQALQERDAERARMDARDNDVDTEQARWQDAIYKLLLKRVSGTNQIDGGGCESGNCPSHQPDRGTHGTSAHQITCGTHRRSGMGVCATARRSCRVGIVVRQHPAPGSPCCRPAPELGDTAGPGQRTERHGLE